MFMATTVSASGGTITAQPGPVEAYYGQWPGPDLIISDGAYGLSLFESDPASARELPAWYAPHVAAWSRAAAPRTVLYLWGTELSWATVHPLLLEHGWVYRNLITWDKGLSHVAGRTNGQTMRSYPIATEVCGFYVRRECFDVQEGGSPLAQWLRREWRRAGFSLAQAHRVVGPAARKYFGQDRQFYFPPEEKFLQLAEYANRYGDPAGRPYFQRDNCPPSSEWYRVHRYHFNFEYGLTNVWQHPPLRKSERVPGSANQKPLPFMERIVRVHKNGTPLVVWEPFGGLATASIAAARLGCQAYVAEKCLSTFRAMQTRIQKEDQQ